MDSYVADAGGNEILRVTDSGAISLVAGLPPKRVTIPEEAAQAAGLPCLAGQYVSEPVPSDVEVGGDGQLYVTTLTGATEIGVMGAGDLWRVNPRRLAGRRGTATLTPMPDYRAHFDFEIAFANGGGMTGTGFRLDLPEASIDESEIARLLVQHLGLALVDEVRLRHLRIVEEQHRGSRGVERSPDADAGDRIVDLSHPIRAGLVTYPGLPEPVITPHLTRADSRSRYAPGTEFAMDVITMIGNTGTYLDSPFHRYADGSDLAGLDLSTLVGLRAEVFHLEDAWDASRRGIRPDILADRDVRGAAVLLHTGWDRLFGTPEYASGAPFLTGEGAQWLIDAGAVLVGIDSLNVDDTESGGERPAHTLLLGAGVHVVEHLTNLGAVPARGARFTAAAPAIEGFGTFPVRAFAEVPA